MVVKDITQMFPSQANTSIMPNYEGGKEMWDNTAIYPLKNETSLPIECRILIVGLTQYIAPPAGPHKPKDGLDGGDAVGAGVE